YCAFYVLPNQEGGYVLSREDVFAKIDELLELGGDLVGFNGGFNPKLPLDYYCDLFASVRERYGDRVEFYALTIAEFVFLADRAKLSYAEAAARLRDAGVHWVTGGGSEIPPQEYRRHIALSRSFLDNVKHIRTSVLTQNEDAFRALDYGADDFDLPIEDEVTQKAGARIDLDLEALLAVPRRLGYTVEYRRAERPAALTPS